jgi:hypothetical protein
MVSLNRPIGEENEHDVGSSFDRGRSSSEVSGPNDGDQRV